MLSFLVAWLAERGITRPAEVTRPVLESYQRWLFHYRKSNGDPLSFRSQSQRLLAVRAFYKWAARQRHVLHNPASEIELPKAERRLPRPALTAAEAELVLAQPDLDDLPGVRDRAILEVFYSTGIRRSELAHLAVTDIDHERATLLVRQGKGRKDRMIPIGDRALAWVSRYLAEARPKLAVAGEDDGTLFLTGEGTGLALDALTRLAAGYVKASGVPKAGACHLFRHTMATLMLEGGADIRYIQAMLGHAELSTTQIYAQVSVRALQAVHAATHPAAANTPRAQRDGDRGYRGDEASRVAVSELASILPAASASAATAPAAGNSVGASHPGMILPVGASHAVSADQCRGQPSSRAYLAPGSCAAEDAGGLAKGGCSFTAGTKVLLASGAAIPISALKIGDKVLVTNTRTGRTQPEKVTSVMVNHDTDLYDLKIRAGTRTAAIHTTSNHPFWIPAARGNGGHWAEAGTLRYGTRLRIPSGGTVTVTGGWAPKVTTGWMWDITVPGNNDHDFYIQAADTSVLVHNCPVGGEMSSDELRAEARDKWQAATGRRGAWDNLQIHHLVPLEWRGVYSGDINGLDNLVGMSPEDHGGITEAWRIWKEGLGGRIPTEPEVLLQRDYLNKIYGPLMTPP
jgi:integrase/recombinase XerD